MEGEITMTNCAKRPRSSLNPEQPHATSLVDQPDAIPATTTVKRSSKFRGLSRHHQSGRYEARFGNKYIYLGTGSTQEEAGHAWLRSGAYSVCFHQECVKRKMQSDPSNKSSATALGILLRSSMFKELVQKNMNDETEENERKKFKVQSDDDKVKCVE